MGAPQNEWFIMEKILLKWMIWGYPFCRKPPYILEMGKRMTISFLLPGELSGDILCLIAAMLYADAWLKTTLQ